ncbi:MAG: PSD1 and planctomycete cytochrome C domain-containing protein [Lentisphaeraceae bacterium]|nr:PSD1 and planctomycete cytochrome C domain-containing protein [Lentisphaeraceae bacterium]
MRYILFLFLSYSTYGAVDFEKDIKPIFEAKCTKCHGAKKDKGGLALHSRRHAFSDPNGEVILAPGKPEDSLLYRKLVTEDEDEYMPPKGPLAKEQIELIKQWISEGAHWPEDENEHKTELNWSLKPTKKNSLPKVSDQSWPANEIDYFILNKMEKAGFKPEESADPETLIRRVYLDLTGQFPSITEIESFKKNPSVNNFEKTVDRLLKSTDFGEHWATHWLDLARFAHSDGYQRDGFKDVYPYRDWVIKALNNDKTYDQFVIEQLAGDLLPNPSKDQLIATCFNRNTTVNMEAGTDVKHDRVKQVMERVDVMGTVFLGSSLGCAQCHNHKYDPYSIKDYYSFMSFFNNTNIETRMGNKGKGRTIFYVGEDLKDFSGKSSELYQKSLKEKSALEKKYIAKVSKLENGEKGKSKKKKPLKMKACEKIHREKYKKNPELNGMMAELKKAKQVISRNAPVVTRVMKEMAQPRDTHILLRGEHTNPGKKVSATVPEFLHDMPKGAPSNRLGLAQWLVDQENPLLARAVVNRWWAEFFGRGLSVTLEDLGKQGEAPTHPELLDWLAADFKSHWSRKTLLKKIVMSKTYQQASITSQDKLVNDPSNDNYSRATPLRLKGETIRDVVLQVSGLLSKKMYGPAVKPPQPTGVWRVIGRVDNTYEVSSGEDRYRKGVYTIWRRSAHYPSFANFDAPDRGACAVRRTRSNTPMQALTLMNDEVYVEAAQAFAKRIQNYSQAKTNVEKIRYAFMLSTSREPDAREMRILQDILEREQKENRGKKYDKWFTVATVLINMHDTITRR